jgi:hypothetical protein
MGEGRCQRVVPPGPWQIEKIRDMPLSARTHLFLQIMSWELDGSPATLGDAGFDLLLENHRGCEGPAGVWSEALSADWLFFLRVIAVSRKVGIVGEGLELLKCISNLEVELSKSYVESNHSRLARARAGRKRLLLALTL